MAPEVDVAHEPLAAVLAVADLGGGFVGFLWRGVPTAHWGRAVLSGDDVLDGGWLGTLSSREF